MTIYEIGTGYTSIPAQMGAATEIVVEELTKAMMEKGKEVLLLDIADHDRLPNQLPIVEIKIPSSFFSTDVQLGIAHKLKRVVYSVCLARKIKKLIQHSKDEILLHFHNQYNLYFFLKLISKKLRSRVKIAYTVHSYVWHGNWEDIKNTIRKKYFQELFCIKQANKVFVLNHTTMTNMVAHVGLSQDKIILVDNGVNTNIYHPLNEEQVEAIKEKYNFNGKKLFVQVGSVCDRKNQLTSLQLLLPYMTKDPNIVFCFAGGIVSKEYLDQVLRFAKENGIEQQVHYLGEVKPGVELNEIYNMAEAMVFPSKAEGFSLVIIESMAAGVPVLINEELEFKLKDSCLRYTTKESFECLVNEFVLEKTNRDIKSKDVRDAVMRQYSWSVVSSQYLKNF